MGVARPPTQLDHLCNQTQSDAIRRNQEAIIMGVAWPPTQLDDLCNQMHSDAINRQSGGHQRGHQRPSETIREATRGQSEANQRPLRGDHLRALEIAISLESVDQTCGERRRGERLYAEAQSRLPSRSRA